MVYADFVFLAVAVRAKTPLVFAFAAPVAAGFSRDPFVFPPAERTSAASCAAGEACARLLRKASIRSTTLGDFFSTSGSGAGRFLILASTSSLRASS